MITIPVAVSASTVSVGVSVSTTEQTVGVSPAAAYTVPEAFHGSYTVTPNGAVQVLQTAGKLATDNITINPVPQNYGLIT